MSGPDHDPSHAYQAYAHAMGISVPWSELSSEEQAAWQAVVSEVLGNGITAP